MRHRLQGRKLNRTSAHRLSMLRNASQSLMTHEQIRTTLPKAKELKRYADKIITLGKRGRLHDRRRAIAKLGSPAVVDKVFTVLAERYRTRSGGYSRIVRAGTRTGDAAPMAVIELVDRDIEAKGQPLSS